MVDAVLIAALAAVLGFAALWAVKGKKSGKKCAGCPYSGSCAAGTCGK